MEDTRVTVPINLQALKEADVGYDTDQIVFDALQAILDGFSVEWCVEHGSPRLLASNPVRCQVELLIRDPCRFESRMMVNLAQD